MEEAMINYYRVQALKDSTFSLGLSLGHFLSHSLILSFPISISLLLHSLGESSCQIVRSFRPPQRGSHNEKQRPPANNQSRTGASPWDDCSPELITTLWETLNQNHPDKQHPDSWFSETVLNVYCVKLLTFGCNFLYSIREAIDN